MRSAKCLALLLLGWLAVCLLAASYQVAVGPTTIMESYFDYMIGGYYDLPMQELGDAWGGGRLALFHARNTASQVRKIRYAYIDAAGSLQNASYPWETTDVQMGYASVAIDQESGISFYAWHQNMDEDVDYELVMQYELDPGSDPGLYSDLSIVVDPPNAPLGLDGEYIWPSVKIGPSPTPDMRRLYIMGRYNGSDDAEQNSTVLIAFTDFNAASIYAGTPMNWQYTTIPTLVSWHEDPLVNRRLMASFTVGDDGRLYVAGNHYARLQENNNIVVEPDLDVFICDNYGAGTWQHYQASSEIQLNNPYNQAQNIYAFYDHGRVLEDSEVTLKNCYTNHFNLVLDSDGKLHMPGNWALVLAGTWSTEYNSIKDIVFDTNSHSFDIREIYPVTGTSSDDIWWAPWDADGDHQADSWSFFEPLPQMTSVFPFCHWDTTLHSDVMRFHYSYFRMTEPDADGNMACLWQDSNKARLYHLYPGEYPQYEAYNDNAEIYLSVSTNNGLDWGQTEVISAVTEPALSGMIPMWVYPSNRFIQTGSELQKRMYLLFADDDDWGANCVMPYHIPFSCRVNYMALDIDLPVSADDPHSPVVHSLVLEQNAPNPCSDHTTIKYGIQAAGDVVLELFNLRGQKLRTLYSGRREAGEHSLDWDGLDETGRALSSGIYLYKLTSRNDSRVMRLLLLR